MRYEDIRRVRGVGSAWLHLKLWFRSAQSKPVMTNPNDLSDHVRRDIGLPEEVRYVDWRALRENGWS